MKTIRSINQFVGYNPTIIRNMILMKGPIGYNLILVGIEDRRHSFPRSIYPIGALTSARGREDFSISRKIFG